MSFIHYVPMDPVETFFFSYIFDTQSIRLLTSSSIQSLVLGHFIHLAFCLWLMSDSFTGFSFAFWLILGEDPNTVQYPEMFSFCKIANHHTAKVLFTLQVDVNCWRVADRVRGRNACEERYI